MPAQLDPDPAQAGSRLLKRAQHGDKQAFMDLFAAHDRRVYSLALRVAGNVAVAEDLTRDIFIQAFGNLGAVSDEADFARSLYRRAVKNCLSAVHCSDSSKLPRPAAVASTEITPVNVAHL